MTIKVQSRVTVTIKDHDHTLTQQEAELLWNELNKALGKPPATIPSLFYPPGVRSSPFLGNPWEPPFTVTCSSKDST